MGGRTAERLLATLSAVCPIESVTANGSAENSYFTIKGNATPQQFAAANIAFAAFDWSDAAQATWESLQNPDKKSLNDLATQAIADIDTYLGLASPTSAQQTAAIKKLAQNQKAIIKRLIQVQ